MCGIVGIVSRDRDIAGDLVHGIRRLEYRGYDSCGVAIRNGNGILVSKDVGGPSRLDEAGFFSALRGTTGIAHTRWATHGGVSRANAHPHPGPAGRVVIVHNGVLSNYRVLREQLRGDGHEFQSETDSEIVAHLIDRALATGHEPREAVRQATLQLEGTYALAVMVDSVPDRIWAVRKESPLVVGFSDDQVMVASDPLALGHCGEVMLLDDGEMVEVHAKGCEVYDLGSGSQLERERRVLDGVEDDPELGEYAHYMAKEMAESAAAVRAALTVEDEAIEAAAGALLSARRAFLTGMGTAYHMAYFGHYLLAQYARVHCPVVTSDELPDVAWFDSGDAVLGVSQSGETYDTLRALRLARKSGATTLAVCNVANSSMSREVDQVLLQRAGPEIAVLATKSAISQAVLLTRIALEAGRQRGTLGADHDALLAELQSLPEIMDGWRERISEQCHAAAVRLLGLEKWFFLGRSLYAAVAMEGSLKFKEVTYRHAEGMAAGFLKHGTISLIDQDMGTALFLPPVASGELRDLSLTALEEVHSRGGPILLVGSANEEERGLADAWVETPGESHLVDGFLQILAGQYLAYHTARALGRDVDRPRALAKSVTVP